MSFVVTMNGQTMFDQIIATPNLSQADFWSADLGVPIIVFDFPMDLHGAIPFTLTVDGGKMTWSLTETNYHGDVKEMVDFKLEDGIWPNGVPSSKQEVWDDINSLTPEQLITKYTEEASANAIYQITIPSADNWQDVNGENTAESDGRDNVRIDGIPRPINIALRESGVAMGDIHYQIESGSTFACDLIVVPPVLS